MVVACAYYLHILGIITLIPSHEFQPFVEDDLIKMEVPQCPKCIQLDPISGVTISVTVEVSMDCWCHDGEGLCFLAERFGSGDGERKTLLTRQIAFEPLPASVLFALGGSW
jgi:hypothetical protein